jgi:hypothetical protein
MLIAKYTCNASGIVPSFNSEYIYEVNETENNGIYTVEITSEVKSIMVNVDAKDKKVVAKFWEIDKNPFKLNYSYSVDAK